MKDGRYQASMAIGKKDDPTWVKVTFGDNEKVKHATQAEKYLNKGDLVLIVGSPINEQYNSTWVQSFSLIKKKTAPKAE
jgi:single-stranded DNA-binding protein